MIYQSLFEGGGDLLSILALPYPLFDDIITRQIAEKKKEKKLYESKLATMKYNAPKKKVVRRR
ncbi:MAG: hypothetical protein PHD05_01265 [Sphaerochaetaceae bacterium]|nr:hypothetical protein [Sphaerochaetaceae bacterium]